MNNYSVYKHTTPNGKVYIGITGTDPAKRWNCGNGYRANKHFWNAIKRYGWDNIKHEILFSGLSKSRACSIEIKLISEHRSNEPEHGYNNSTGGEATGTGRVVSVEEREKLSAIWTGRKFTEATRKKMSESAKRRNPETRRRVQTAETRRKLSEYRKGKTLSDETRKKLSAANSDAGNPAARKVEQYTLSGEYVATYDCIKEAANVTGTPRTHICSVCRGNRKQSGGFVWKYAKAV